MAISVKVMHRPEPGRTSYMRATLMGMSLTFKHMIRPQTVTLQYPEEQPELSPRWRGTHVMEVHADGRPKCVACGLCPTVCPANCIRLVGGEDDQGNRYPLVYEIDEFRCIFCDRFVYDLDRLMEQDHPTTLLWDPSDPRSE